MSEKLEPFKIAARPGVSQPKAGEGPKQESPSLGFKRIEGILETEEPAAIAHKLAELTQSLHDFEKASKANKDKSAAKKAIVAVERTSDLMTYLFQTKESLVSGQK